MVIFGEETFAAHPWCSTSTVSDSTESYEHIFFTTSADKSQPLLALVILRADRRLVRCEPQNTVAMRPTDSASPWAMWIPDPEFPGSSSSLFMTLGELVRHSRLGWGGFVKACY
jgi:hypothetical protein